MSAAFAVRTAAQALVDTLELWNIDRVFICPGSTEAAFLDAVSAEDRIKPYLTTHESIAIAMADGYSRATGKPSAVYLHANVGLTNALSHLSAAKLARSPVLVLNGLKDTRLQASGGFTTAPYMRDFVRQYVKTAWQSLSADAVSQDADRALRAATAEPSGPAWLGLSQDIMEAKTEAVARTAVAVWPKSRPANPELGRAAEILAAAERPLLVAGSEVSRHEATEVLARLAAVLNAPVMLEERRGLERPSFPATDTRFAGIYDPRRSSVQDADVIFFIGARCFLEFEPTAEAQVPAGAKILHSHVDPEEIGKLYQTDVALVGDEQEVLAGILDQLPEQGTRNDHLLRAASAELNISDPQPLTATGSLTALDVVQGMNEVAEAATVYVDDSTTASSLLLRGLHLTSADQLFKTASGSLGWGMGAALGVQLARPDADVIAVLGDGVFQFGIQALWTAARYELPVTFLVLNNQAYAANGAALQRYRQARGIDRPGPLPGVDISGPHIANIAGSFGLEEYRVDERSQLVEALKQAGRSRRPTLIEVMTDPNDYGPSPV